MDSPTPGRSRHNPDDLERLIRQCWHEARLDYEAAGAPFGPSQRALELWLFYEACTTVN